MDMQIKKNFQVTLPAAIRKRLHLKIGYILETTIKDDKIIIVPKKAIDAEAAWFWTKEWQEAEKETEEDLRTGKVKKFKSIEDLIKHLDKLT